MVSHEEFASALLSELASKVMNRHKAPGSSCTSERPSATPALNPGARSGPNMIRVIRMNAADPAGAIVLPNAMGNIQASPAFVELVATTEKAPIAFIAPGRGEDRAQNEHCRDRPNKPQFAKAWDRHIKLM